MKCTRGLKILCVVLVFSITEISSQTVSLTVDPAMPVTEGDIVRFTCRTMGNSTTITFQRSGRDSVIVSWITENSQCIVLHPHNSALYHASCDGPNSQYFMEILNVSSDFHQDNITCALQYGVASDDKVDGFVFMEVNVPLKHVEINVSEHFTLQEGHTTEISCTARSRPTPNFTWFISGRQIHNNYTTITYNDISVTSTVRYTGSRGDNNDSFYCKAYNGITEVTSSSTFLNITYSPNISVTYNLKPIEGTEQFNLTCLILDSNPTENRFSWYVNASLSSQSNNIMTLNNLNRNDSNNYTCQATNGIGHPTNATILLDVLYKGSILKFTTNNISVMEGAVFNACVEAEGKPAPNVTWSVNSTDTILLTENQVLYSTLNITTICEDTGNYVCVVDNGLLVPDIAHFRITVSCKPRTDHHTNNNNNVQVTDGAALSLKVTFVAFPQPNITWYFRGNNSQKDTTLWMETSSVSDEAIHVSTLSILKANSSHSGLYTVMAINSLGADTLVFSVNIIGSSASTTEPSIEAIIIGVVGAFVFICLVAMVVNCYRTKKRKEKERSRSWKTSPKDMDDIIKENTIEEPVVDPIEPMYSTSRPNKSQPRTTKVEVSERNVYAKVAKSSNQNYRTNEFEIQISDTNHNTKL